MKSFLVTLCLLAQFASLNFVPAVAQTEDELYFGIKEKALVSVESKDTGISDTRASITWATTCLSKDGGGGESTLGIAMEYAACSSNRNCSVVTDVFYPVRIQYRPARNEYALTLNITASPKSGGKLNQTLTTYLSNPPFYANIRYYVDFDLVLYSQAFKGRSGSYSMQVKLFNPIDNRNVFCRNFDATVVYNSAGSAQLSIIAFVLALVVNKML